MTERHIEISIKTDVEAIEISILDRDSARQKQGTFPKTGAGLIAASGFTSLWIDALMQSFVSSLGVEIDD